MGKPLPVFPSNVRKLEGHVWKHFNNHSSLFHFLPALVTTKILTILKIILETCSLRDPNPMASAIWKPLSQMSEIVTVVYSIVENILISWQCANRTVWWKLPFTWIYVWNTVRHCFTCSFTESSQPWSKQEHHLLAE